MVGMSQPIAAGLLSSSVVYVFYFLQTQNVVLLLFFKQ